MKMFNIMMRHAGPKSQVKFVLLRVLADSEQQILDRLDTPGGKFTYGAWAERGEWDEEAHDDDERGPDGKRLIPIYDDKYNEIGRETYIQRMLRLRGEFNDSDASFEDAYYGIRHYGWTEGVELSEDDAATLMRLGLLEDWRVAAIGEQQP